ncbi:hypothetical protein HK101_010023 [Irineochytrium annulatum]|nr:hypothetical protein HK101_010023 [Irineochytrium annulatum]
MTAQQTCNSTIDCTIYPVACINATLLGLPVADSNFGICVPPQPVGAACVYHTDCAASPPFIASSSSLNIWVNEHGRCFGGTCRGRNGTAGEACLVNVDAYSDVYDTCDQQNTCFGSNTAALNGTAPSTTNSSTCVALRSQGAPCWFDVQCESTLLDSYALCNSSGLCDQASYVRWVDDGGDDPGVYAHCQAVQQAVLGGFIAFAVVSWCLCILACRLRSLVVLLTSLGLLAGGMLYFLVGAIGCGLAGD